VDDMDPCGNAGCAIGLIWAMGDGPCRTSALAAAFIRLTNKGNIGHHPPNHLLVL